MSPRGRPILDLARWGAMAANVTDFALSSSNSKCLAVASSAAMMEESMDSGTSVMDCTSVIALASMAVS